jgi:hypothetical protein
MEPWIANAGGVLTNDAALPMIGRCLVVYFPPVIIALIYDRYTGAFDDGDYSGIFWFWPIVLPFVIAYYCITFFWDNWMGGMDWIVALLSRKVVAEDEEGRVYTQIQPRSGARRKDRIAAYVEVKDHTGKHSIRIDPDYLKEDDFSVHGAIALTFKKNPKDYHPAIET